MKLIVLGHTGFVGKHLLNNIQDSYGLSIRESNWEKRLNDSDVIINLIGKAHDHNNKANEEDFYYANYILLKEIFNAFLASKSKVFIHVSSIAAVEEFENETKLDENNFCNPLSWYGKSKRKAELWLLDQILPPDKKVLILRPPMIHGPDDKGNLKLLYKFVIKGIPYPLTLFNNKRSFISIYNFNFLIHSIVNDIKKVKSGIYNLADDESLSTNEIIEIIEKISNKKIKHLRVPKIIIQYLANIGNYLPIVINSKKLLKLTGTLEVSNNKIKNMLNIDKLPFDANTGLMKTIVSFKEQNSNK